MALVNELENWLRHVEDQLEKLQTGEVKTYTRFRQSLEGLDFEGNKREYDDKGNPVLANNEGPNHR